MLNKFKKNTDGNVAMMFAFLLTGLFIVSAIALDASRLLSLTDKLQRVSDAAALAGAKVAISDPVRMLR